eukprot:TRINITY_DN1046_c0_g1_i1.p1 TRINITY_DN1046_c0_g1~~TRINITY_DN1046_c0_g1_i1.p1  ORF type:complete len:200 (-),score=65.75 TRINITY_DN1046_c0_g1_i1:299-898(-)
MDDLDIWSSKKKKKKTKSSSTKKAETTEEETAVLDEKNLDTFLKGEGEYPYSFLLNRALDMVRSRKPTARKSNIPAPIVLREGTKKTVIENFKDIAKHLNRGLDHLSRFIAVELSTTIASDSAHGLILKTRLDPKSVVNLLGKYVQVYVVCHMCESENTLLYRDPATRLYMLKCESCSATRSVPAIKEGVVVQATRRKK